LILGGVNPKFENPKTSKNFKNTKTIEKQK